MTNDDQPNKDFSGSRTFEAVSYQKNKSNLSKFIDIIVLAGSSALENPNLQTEDRSELERGLETLSRAKQEFLSLISKTIDDSHPPFLQQCVIVYMLSIMSGVFMTSKYLRLTDSAVQEALKNQAQIARDARKPRLSREKASRIEMVRRHAALVGADLSRTYKTADAILDAVNAERLSNGKAKVSLKSIQNWINEAAAG